MDPAPRPGHSDFNADVKNAWVETYTLLATVMQEAAAEASQESGEDQESGGADEATQEQEPALQE